MTTPAPDYEGEIAKKLSPRELPQPEAVVRIDEKQQQPQPLQQWRGGYSDASVRQQQAQQRQQ